MREERSLDPNQPDKTPAGLTSLPMEGASLDPDDLLAVQERLPADYRSGFVAVIGRPNVGKSTLLNQLLGQKIAITSDKPQTTRDQILGIRSEEDAQYIFLDTPGLHQPKHKLGQHMVQIAMETIANDVDLVLWLVDGTVPPTEEDQLITERLRALHFERPLPPITLVLNKIDEWQGDSEALLQRENEYVALLQWLVEAGSAEGQTAIPVHLISALYGDRIDLLLEHIREQLPLGPRYYPADQVTDLNLRFLTAELIREQALRLLRHEVPHSIAVAVTDFAERDENLTYIAATLYVERASQKGIVLGSRGSMIKQIGQAARPEIEKLVGTQVYLDLWVKVWAKWRRRENMLRRLGYERSRG